MDQIRLKTIPTFGTERLSLRQLAVSDVEEIFLLRADDLINKYLGRQAFRTWEEALGFIEKVKSNNLYYWAITQKGKNKLLGTICLFNVSSELSKGEIGYELLTEYQGNGIMEESAIKIIQFAFETLELKAIDAFTHIENQSSTDLLKRLNFSRIGGLYGANSNVILFRLEN